MNAEVTDYPRAWLETVGPGWLAYLVNCIECVSVWTTLFWAFLLDLGGAFYLNLYIAFAMLFVVWGVLALQKKYFSSS